MSKKSLVQRELKRKKTFNKFNVLRSTIKNNLKNSASFEERIKNYSLLQKLPRNSSKTRLLRFQEFRISEALLKI